MPVTIKTRDPLPPSTKPEPVRLPPRKPPKKAPPATNVAHTPRHAKFSALVLRWRTARKLPQAKAAALLGVPHRTFQDWEYGRRAPKGLALQLITAKLNSVNQK